MSDLPDHKPDTYNLNIAADRRAAKAELRDAREAVMMNYFLVAELNREVVTRDTIPEEWLTLDEIYPPTGKKIRVTLLLDEEVVKYFRARGRGYQAFINDVLKFFVKLRMSKIIEGYGDRGPEGEVL